MPDFHIGQRRVGTAAPTYFIADISANHDGSLARAKELIRLAAEAGADGAKFQHFRAPEIVSRQGFASLGAQVSHQARWRRSVFDVYQDASVPWEWTPDLHAACRDAGIEFFSTPYDFAAVDMLHPYVRVYKIGSGDVNWLEFLHYVASKGKPVVLSSGASDIGEVQRAVRAVQQRNPNVALLQCNTNYTGSAENFDHIHLHVLHTYRTLFPDVVTGLSCHTPGHATALGAVALGGRIIEKHFTDDKRREGPDHPFSMTPDTWREMVERTRELERALGGSAKFVAPNETQTVIVQRRCVRAARALPAGTRLGRADLRVLRPAPRDAIGADETALVVGRTLRVAVAEGEALQWTMIAPEPARDQTGSAAASSAGAVAAGSSH